MAKKKRTVKQEQIKHRLLQFACYGGMGVSIVTPFAVMIALNQKTWFTKENGLSVGIGFALAGAVTAIAIVLVAHKKEKDSTFTNGWITLLVMWFAVAAIFKLLSSIYAEIFGIMFWTGIGLAGAFGCDILSKIEKQKVEDIKEARKKVKEEQRVEQAREEESKIEF